LAALASGKEAPVRSRGDEHPTLRAFAIILAIVCVVVIFQLYATLMVAAILLQVAFFLAIAFFVFLLWRERRGDIAIWPARAQWAFYGAALIALANLALYFGARLFASHSLEINGLTGVAWLLVFPLCGLAIWRTWRDQHTYY
jgi:small-conductance mechanosensitive channel